MTNKKGLVILSGGMDSTTLLYKMIEEGFLMEAISFNYGQRHKKELEFAKKTCEKLNIKHQIIDITNLNSLLGGSALTDNIEVPEGHYADENMKLTVVPNRNMIMLSIASGYALANDIKTIGIGVHAGDHAIYPDCREDFINLFKQAVNSGNYGEIEIYTPYIHKDKGDIAIDGKRMGIDYNTTWTCYKGLDVPCGKCGACQEREEAINKKI